MAYCYHDYGGRIEVFGSEATFGARGSLQQAASYQSTLRRGEHIEPTVKDSYAECFRDAIEDVTDAVLHRGDPSVGAEDGLRVVRVIEAIYESARAGVPVAMADGS
jgi:predicted dehydrogenase